MPRVYDIERDETRDATQDDVDKLVRCTQALVSVLTYLRSSSVEADRLVAEAAVMMSTGKTPPQC